MQGRLALSFCPVKLLFTFWLTVSHVASEPRVTCTDDAITLCYPEGLCDCTVEFLDSIGTPCAAAEKISRECVKIPFDQCSSERPTALPQFNLLPEGFELLQVGGTLSLATGETIQAAGQCLRHTQDKVPLPIVNGKQKIRIIGEGEYDIAMTLCRDADCGNPVVPPQKFEIAEDTPEDTKYYVQILLDPESLPEEVYKQTYVDLVDCWTGPSTPLPKGLGYAMVNDGCPLQSPIPTSVYDSSPGRVRFSTPVFSFGGTPIVYFHCNVRLCPTGNPDCYTCGSGGDTTASGDAAGQRRALTEYSSALLSRHLQSGGGSDVTIDVGPFVVPESNLQLQLNEAIPDPTDEVLPIWAIGLLAAGALIFLIGIIAYFVYRRRKKEKTARNVVNRSERAYSQRTVQAKSARSIPAAKSERAITLQPAVDRKAETQAYGGQSTRTWRKNQLPYNPAATQQPTTNALGLTSTRANKPNATMPKNEGSSPIDQAAVKAEKVSREVKWNDDGALAPGTTSSPTELTSPCFETVPCPQATSRGEICEGATKKERDDAFENFSNASDIAL